MFLWSSFLLGLSDGMLVALSHTRSPALYLTASVLCLLYWAFIRSKACFRAANTSSQRHHILATKSAADSLDTITDGLIPSEGWKPKLTKKGE